MDLETFFLSSSTLYYFISPRLSRRYTAHDINCTRPEKSEYVTTFLFAKQHSDESKFYEYMHMCKSTFAYIVEKMNTYDDHRY